MPGVSKALLQIKAQEYKSKEGIPLEVCSSCFNKGRSYLKLPWEMSKNQGTRRCAKCHADVCRKGGRKWDSTKRNNYSDLRMKFRKEYSVREKAKYNIFLCRWILGLETHSFFEKVDCSTPEGRKRHAQFMKARSLLKHRIRAELARGDRIMPPRWELEPHINRSKWKRPSFRKSNLTVK